MTSLAKVSFGIFIIFVLSVSLCHGKPFYVDYDEGLETERFQNLQHGSSPANSNTGTTTNNVNDNNLLNSKITQQSSGSSQESKNKNIIWPAPSLKTRNPRSNSIPSPSSSASSEFLENLWLSNTIGDEDDSDFNNVNEQFKPANMNYLSKNPVALPFPVRWNKMKTVPIQNGSETYRKYFMNFRDKKSFNSDNVQKRQSILYRQCFFNPISCFR